MACIGTRASDRFTADWESLKQRKPAPEWFRDAKFGIYFHWGVYSVPAFGSEWYPRNMHLKGRRENKHHTETYGDPTEFGYHDFVPRFKAEKFDADAWAELFRKAGARFAGPVCEHHDGFAMWASKVTPWNVGDMGPKRDLTGELEKAIRARGVRFVATFHHARNSLWEKKGKDQWSGHYDGVKNNYPGLLEDPKNAILYGHMPRGEFLDMWKAKLVEVIDKYKPDLMWFDSWLDEIPEEVRCEYLAYYFNRAVEWNQEVVVTYKQRDLPREVGVEDFEKGRADHLTKYTWLTDDTISRGSWCYTQDLRIKPMREVLHVLIDIVSKNGQLLLNISPLADGTIPEDQRQVLLGVGAWLEKYGEAIYDTRPWVVFGEGPTRIQKGGAFIRMKGGYKAEDIRFSTRGDVLYATFLGAPNGEVSISSLAEGRGLCGGSVKHVTLLGHGEADFSQDNNGLKVRLPGKLPSQDANVLKIEGLKIAGFEPDMSIHFEGGKAKLDAGRAELHGKGIGTESKDGGKKNVGFWDDPAAYVTWEVNFPQARTYDVSGRFAATGKGAFLIETGGGKLTGQPPVTGAWDDFETVAIGTIEIGKAGKQVVKIGRDPDAQWKAINMTFLEFRAR